MLIVTVELASVCGQRSTARVAIVPNFDAPAELIQADVTPDATGAPDAVRVTIRNFSQEEVIEIVLEALVFDGDDALRREIKYSTRPVGGTEVFSMLRGPLEPGGTAMLDLPIHDAHATAEWNFAVAVTEVRLGSRRWQVNAADLRRQAMEVASSLR